jgi:MoaA/NifB/PqqE/SkfB family radical SAM enzyme
VVKSAIKYNINIGVGVSLEGIGENHDLVRGVRGLFGKVDWLLHELLALRNNAGDKLSITVGFVLSDLTLPALEEVKTYIQKLDVPLHVQWYNEASYYDNIGEHLLCNTELIIEAVRLLLPTPIHEMGIKLLRGQSIKFPCFALYTFCLLKCNGDIVPCFDFWDVKIGNVRESSPSLIWHSTEAKKARRMVKECQGCLNACGVGWSFGASFYPLLLHRFKRILRITK